MATITKRLVRSAKPRGKKYEISCSSLRGFILRVLPSGKKVYFARCRHDGRDTRQRIGLTSELSFEDARARAGLLLTRGTTTPTGRADSAPAPGDASPYLRDFTRRFLDGHVDIAVKASTARAYRLALKNHILPRFGGARLAAITREDVETWVGSFRRHPQAARTACMVLSCLFSKAAQWGALPPSHVLPTRGVRLKPTRARDRFLTADERARVEEVLQRGLELPTSHRGALHWGIVYAIRTLALTGMRSSEVFGLSWDRVDMSRKLFRLADSKTGQKLVPFSDEVLELLREVQRLGDGRSSWVFQSRAGRSHVAKASVGRAWRRIRERAGLGDDVVIHSLRHSFASDALMSGVPLAVLGRVLGHKSPRTTARYAHVSDAAIVDALKKTSERIATAQQSPSSARGRRDARATGARRERRGRPLDDS